MQNNHLTSLDMLAEYARLAKFETCFAIHQAQRSLLLLLVVGTGIAITVLGIHAIAIYALLKWGVGVIWILTGITLLYAGASIAAWRVYRNNRALMLSSEEVFEGTLEEGRDTFLWILKRFV